MRDLNVLLALIGGLTLGLSLLAGVLRSRWYLPTEPMVAVVVGALVGAYGFDVFGLGDATVPLAFVEQFARVTVALAVTSIALRLPATYFPTNARSMATLLGPGMLGMWLASTLATYLLLPVGLPVALLIGAALTPTDPVLANSIVVGAVAERHIPERIRQLLSGEAGANDGGAYPLVLLAILVLAEPLGTVAREWVLSVLLWEVLGAVIIGFGIGAFVGTVEDRLSEGDYVDETPVFTVTVALTATVLGTVALLGTDALLAVFVAGVAYNWRADPGDEAEERRVSEVFNRLLTIPAFVLFGMVLPWAEWAALGWRGPTLVVAVLALRRMPTILALRSEIAQFERPADALFAGWFGPIGLAAVFYATLAVRETTVELVWPVVSLVVLGSILAHGATASGLTFRYARARDD